jgi:hypothetical protein
MDIKQAILTLIEEAIIRSENTQDGLPETITADMSDETLATIGIEWDDYERDEARELRNTLKAVEVAEKFVEGM